MFNRFFAIMALTGRRLDSASDYVSDVRRAAHAEGKSNGLVASAATRW